MNKLLLIVMLCPLMAKAQVEKGIKFEQKLSWQQMQRKAKEEQKYIFVDCYATWCAPCKIMDSTVYKNDTVGILMNEKLMSVKVQMDKTRSDNARVKLYYPIADMIAHQYTLPGYPSYLFFAPDGTLVYKDVGLISTKRFIEILQKALDPQSLQYYKEFEAYKRGQRHYETMGGLAVYTQNVLEQVQLANQIASDYKNGYFDKLSSSKLLSRENFEFMSNFSRLLNTDDLFFKLCYNDPDAIDALKFADQGWAMDIVKRTITREQLTAKLLKNKKTVFSIVNWDVQERAIKFQFPKVDARRIVLDFQLYYYGGIAKNWQEWAKYFDKAIELYPQEYANGFYLNDGSSWPVFIHCSDPVVLEKALTWIDRAIELDPNTPGFLDTKANLFYKLGKVAQAIELEQRAANVCMNFYQQDKIGKAQYLKFAESYKSIEDLMQKRKPTYSEVGTTWTPLDLERIKNGN